MRTTAALLTLALLASPVATQATGKVSPLSLRDPGGALHRVFPAPDGQTTVVLFTATGCPISNSYAPDYRGLVARYRDRPVRFLAVHGGGEAAEAVASHAREYQLPFPVLLDPEQRAVRMLGAKATPEAFVIDPTGRVRYAGRVDNRWASRTVKREVATEFDLTNAITAVVTNKVVTVRRTVSHGCAIVRRDAPAQVATSLTYHRDIAPILQRRCQECHRAGQVAPFELMTYDDALSWGEEIVEFTRAGLMPPWKDEGPRGRFHGDPRLDDAEKEKLAEWVRGGMPEGKAEDAPAPASWPEGWQLGPPDLILEMPVEHEVAAGGRDEFVCFPLKTGLTEDVYVTAIDCQPGNPRVVHHMVGFLDPRQQGRKLDARDPRPGYRRFGGPGFQSEGIFGVWAPGNRPTVAPEGVARLLKANSDIVLQLHYYKTGKVEKDRSKIGLYFAKKPVTHHMNPFWAANFRLRIPAGAKRHETKSTFRLPFELKIIELFPHMHLLGREMKLYAELPDGKTVDLLQVDDWDFNWQLTYSLVEPIDLPKGSVLHLEAVYDNSSDNPRNPNSPPRAVRWGDQTSNEMCIVLMDVVTPGHPKMTWRELRTALFRGMRGDRGRRRRAP